jgi:glycosyltransferase involved in cell wall biosynthesis
VKPRNFDLTHAHFLYSDGAVALQLAQLHGVPYVVTVRNTDVNVFMRYRPDLAPLCWKIAAHARRIIFISPAYRELLLERAPDGLRESLRSKACIVPNGVGNSWLEHAGNDQIRAANGQSLRLLYVGDFSRNKNIATTIRAAALLNRSRATTLTLVGGGGDGEREIDALLATGSYPFVTRLQRVEDQSALAAIYRRHDIFVMPSFLETFGVVYIEALSQGLPIVFSRGQAVDGYFPPGTVGEAVDPRDAESVRRAVAAIAERLDAVRPQCVAAARDFAWPSIARRYVDLYRDAASGHETRRAIAQHD